MYGDEGVNMGVYVVAECGVNWRNIAEAKRMIEVFKECGADACKFQMYKPNMVERHPRSKDLLQIVMTEQMARELTEHGESVGVDVFFTPMYPEAVDILERLNVKKYKVRAKDADNAPLLLKVLSTKKDTYISVANNRIGWDTLDAANAKYRVKLLHCIDRYPAKDEEVHLRSVFPSYRSYISSIEYVGISDHTVGTTCCIAAVALGAEVVEKHVMLDRTTDWVDSAVSITPLEFKDMVQHIRRIEVMRA